MALSASCHVLDVAGHADPEVHALFIHREAWSWKGWVCKRTHRYCDRLGAALQRVVHGGTALRAEPECAFRPFVSGADVLGARANDRDRLAWKTRLRTERAPSAALTRQAVAHRHAHGLADDMRLQLPTAAGGNSRRPGRYGLHFCVTQGCPDLLNMERPSRRLCKYADTPAPGYVAAACRRPCAGQQDGRPGHGGLTAAMAAGVA